MKQKAILFVGSNGGKWPFIYSLDYAQDPSDAIANTMAVSYAALGLQPPEEMFRFHLNELESGGWRYQLSFNTVE